MDDVIYMGLLESAEGETNKIKNCCSHLDSHRQPFSREATALTFAQRGKIITS